jgi:succinate dehydrogenase/fumarate reductase flavoprotein subunit
VTVDERRVAALLGPGTALEAIGFAGTTSVPGLHAAGDAAGVMPSVANAMASGTFAGAMVVGALAGAV